MFWIIMAASHTVHAAAPLVSDTPWQVVGLLGQTTASGAIHKGPKRSNTVTVEHTVLPAHPRPGTGGVCHVQFRHASGSWHHGVTGPCPEPWKTATQAAIGDWSLSVEDRSEEQFFSLVVIFWPDADAAVSVSPGSLNTLEGPSPLPEFLVQPSSDDAGKCGAPDPEATIAGGLCRYSVTVDGEGKPSRIDVSTCGASLRPAVKAILEACRFEPWIAYGKGRSYGMSSELSVTVP